MKMNTVFTTIAKQPFMNTYKNMALCFKMKRHRKKTCLFFTHSNFTANVNCCKGKGILND